MNKFALIAHRVALGFMAVAVVGVTLDGFAQSWAGLYGWAIEHGLNEWKALSFPLLVDAFILIGELGLFVLALEGHRVVKGKRLSWVDLAVPAGVAVVGWSVSLAFNVGHVDGDLSDQVTAAVPPVASMIGLFVLLRTLHRIIGRTSATVGDSAAVEILVEQLEPLEVDPPELAAGDGAEAGLDPGDEEILAEVAAAWNLNDFAQPDEGVGDGEPAGQEPVVDLGSAVRSAKTNGMSQRELMEAFGLTRHGVRKALKSTQPELVSPSSNGSSD
jgi:hypothetical protein